MSIIQWLNYMIISKINRKLQLRINFLMQELIFSQFVVCLEWFCQTRLRLFFKDRKSFDNYGKKPALLISNHRYPIDFLFFIVFVRIFGPLGAIRSFVKYELINVPIYGWAFYFSEFIFLKRDWQQDQKTIAESLKNIGNSIASIALFFAPEGTRFTQRKLEAGIDYAKENNLPIFKHHLIPRTKGFNYILRYIRQNYSNDEFNIYNVELIQKQDSAHLDWKNFLLGRKFSVDFYIEQIHSDQLPEPDAKDSKYSETLYEIFAKKDQVVEQHRTHSFIPDCEMVIDNQRSVLLLLRCMIMNFVIGGSIVYYLLYYLTFAFHNWMIRLIFLLIGIIVIFTLYKIFKSAKISNYGEKKTKKMQ